MTHHPNHVLVGSRLAARHAAAECRRDDADDELYHGHSEYHSVQNGCRFLRKDIIGQLWMQVKDNQNAVTINIGPLACNKVLRKMELTR